jgi:hypothetical protein
MIEYKAEKISGLTYQITYKDGDEDKKFQVVCGSSPDELDELVEFHLRVTNAAPPVYVKTYAQLRVEEYPPITDYIDGVVKGDQAQIDDYIAKCLAVKEKYPKPEGV